MISEDGELDAFIEQIEFEDAWRWVEDVIRHGRRVAPEIIEEYLNASPRPISQVVQEYVASGRGNKASKRGAPFKYVTEEYMWALRLAASWYEFYYKVRTDKIAPNPDEPDYSEMVREMGAIAAKMPRASASDIAFEYTLQEVKKRLDMVIGGDKLLRQWFTDLRSPHSPRRPKNWPLK